MKTLFFILVMGVTSNGQEGLIPAKYLKIKPGVSTRADVEKLFSKKESDQTFVEYNTRDFLVSVSYSTGSCRLSPLRLPQSTVEQVHYSWGDDPEISFRSIVLKPSRFKKRQLSDVVQHKSYVNDEYGIEVTYDNDIKSVISLVLRPPQNIAEMFKCERKDP